ncbi:MAG: glutathione S-transferase [Pseudoxanthomonas suwonensis]|nr:MAG: glutathione S-transferase [Pseudoxanthomonas suwonensis]
MSTQALIFYTHPHSRGRVARWALEETGLRYTTEYLEYGTTMKAPEYLAINPMGKVPALKHGDVVVTENAAIAMYLADLVPDKQLAPPVGSPERGSYYRWISFMGPLEQAMMAKAAGAHYEAMQAGFGTVEDTVNALDAAIGDRDFLVGNRFSMADLLVSACVGWYLQFKLLEPRPNLVRYAQLHGAREAARRGNAIDDARVAESDQDRKR